MSKISVAMCTYNGERYLVNQIESILNQTLVPNEIIVCDDCSTDKTRKILWNFENKYPNLFHIVSNESALGTIKNFEKTIRLTTGDYIFLSDQDDEWEIDKIEKMLAYFDTDPNCILLFSNGSLIDENSQPLPGNLFEKWEFDKNTQILWKDNFEALKRLINNDNKITGATICFKKSLKESALPINTPCNFWHDTWLGMHAAQKGGLRFLDENLIRYRIHSEQQVGITFGGKPEYETEDCREKEKAFDKYVKETFKEVYKYYKYDERSLKRRIQVKIETILNTLCKTK